MKKQIVKVSVLQSAKVIAVLYLVLAIPLGLMMASIASKSLPGGFGVVMFFLFPLLYAFFGFVGSVIGAWLYNVVAARIGGIEFTTAEVGVPH